MAGGAAVSDGARDSREQVLQAAAELFNRDGLRGVGIDTIVSHAGVSKATVYRHFRSREELVLAVLRRHLDYNRLKLDELSGEPDATPVGRVLTVFERMEEWCARPGFRGSVFVTAAAEFGDHEHPVWKVIDENSQYIERWLRHQLELAGVPDPVALTRRLLILLQGVTAVVLLHGDAGFARVAREMADEYLAPER